MFDTVTEQKKHIGYIENGINIDHIPHGNAWYVMKILNLSNSDTQTGVGLNLPSKKLGLKDLIKIENRVLTDKEIDAISLFCIDATLSEIKNFEVVRKLTLTLPSSIDDIIVCPNSRCISHHHVSRFASFIDRKNETKVKCHYCEKQFMLDEITKYKFD